jgi:voltage-gated potassium channel
MKYTTVRRVSLIMSNNLSHGFVIGSILAAGVLVVCALAFALAEDGVSIGGGFLWVARTLLQQEPPFEPSSGVGQFLYFVVVITGVGIIAIVTAGIASRIIRLVMRKDAGMGRAKYEDHIVICGWSPKGPEILRELHADEVSDQRPVAIVAPLQANPSDDDLVTFIQGSPSDAEVLKRAGIERAETAIILADHSHAETGPDERDAMTLLTALAVEALNPAVHTCVEVIRSENLPHFQRAKVDEVVVSAELAGNVLAASAMNHGISHVLADLTGHEAGNEFYGVPAPTALHGHTFGQALEAVKATANALLVGVATGGFRYEVNPPSDRAIEAGDRLLVIADRDPASLLEARRSTRRARAGAPRRR